MNTAKKSDFAIVHGDCLDVMARMRDASVDAIVTDPPYGLVANKKGGSGVASVNLESPYGRARIGTGNGAGGFMGMAWDSAVPGVPFWTEALRVAKPGAHLLAFGGTRTFHRLAVAIEDAGWEVRDDVLRLFDATERGRNLWASLNDAQRHALVEVLNENGLGGLLAWNYATGFPKSHNLDGAWEGWGTALKPAWEPVIVARKPLVGTVAKNVETFGTGALNVDGCRIGTAKEVPHTANGRARKSGSMAGALGAQSADTSGFDPNIGRWPANVMLDEDAASALDEQTGDLGKSSGTQRTTSASWLGSRVKAEDKAIGFGDTGGASRFFYVAKASRSERNAGLEGFPEALPVAANGSPNAVGATRGSLSKPRANVHPTVKPIAVMRWLCRLVTPPGGIVLDPFTGSGTTGVAAVREGFRFCGIEREAEYVEIARARLAHAAEIARARVSHAAEADE